MKLTPSIITSLKSDDPGGDLRDAYAIVSALTITQALSSNRIGVIDVATRYGLAVAEGIRLILETEYPLWVHDQYIDSNKGLDVCNSHVQAAITNPPFTVEQVEVLRSFMNESHPKYPELTLGDLEQARAA